MRGNQFQISGTFTAEALPFKNNNASCYHHGGKLSTKKSHAKENSFKENV